MNENPIGISTLFIGINGFIALVLSYIVVMERITVARIVYAYGVITRYGPSIGRAVGFFGTWFVYLVGASACVYYGFQGGI